MAEEIESLEASHKEAPHLREAHKALAHEVITFLHGEDAYNEAIKISNALFSGNIKELTADQIAMGFTDLPKASGNGSTLCDTLIELKLASSRREAREFIRNGAVMVNGEKLTDESCVLTKELAIEGRFIVLRRGKKNYALVEFE